MLSNISAVLSYCKVVFEVTRERRRDLRSRASIYISTVNEVMWRAAQSHQINYV